MHSTLLTTMAWLDARVRSLYLNIQTDTPPTRTHLHVINAHVPAGCCLVPERPIRILGTFFKQSLLICIEGPAKAHGDTVTSLLELQLLIHCL
jgi:hypothetical protein